MTALQLLLLTAVFFVTSGVSVVTGSTSLITVPAMFAVGVAPRTAVATNMFALTFLSAGGSLPFLRSRGFSRKRLPWLIVLTLAGSICGAYLLLMAPQGSVPLVVSAAMIGVAIFSLIYRQAGTCPATSPPTRAAEIAGFALTFILGIYGGFFSGGYVTVLTAVYVVLFRMTFVEAVATTKLINVFSSGVATVVFMGHGLVDYRLGALLGAAMFLGALIGARFAIRLGNDWLRRIYLTAVWLLGLKMLLYDVLAKNVSCAGPAHHALDNPSGNFTPAGAVD
ncbi:MAG: sulfite exporter TauE/SafE family protein [Bryobacteraceae bacterium]|jgi:uncharacterized membrane protein YfcA